jgi:hypothetical protein
VRAFEAAWALARREGPLVLAKMAARRYIIDSRSFFLYEHRHRSSRDARFAACPPGFEEFFVGSNATADRLSETRCDFRRVVPSARRALDAGAVALCLYHGRELAHVGWLATSPEGRRVLDRLGYEVSFDRGEGWTGAAFTVPSFRNQGLLAYGCLRRFEYLLNAGIAVSRAAVATDNVASHHVTMRFEPRVYAIGHQLRVLNWRRWTERPATSADLL